MYCLSKLQMMFVVPDEYDHTLPGSFFKGRERAYVATSSAPLPNNILMTSETELPASSIK